MGSNSRLESVGVQQSVAWRALLKDTSLNQMLAALGQVGMFIVAIAQPSRHRRDVLTLYDDNHLAWALVDDRSGSRYNYKKSGLLALGFDFTTLPGVTRLTIDSREPIDRTFRK